MHRIIQNLSFIALILLCFSSCELDKYFDGDDDKLTEEEWKEIIETDSLISVSADTFLLSDDPISGWDSMLKEYKGYSCVENAYIYGGALFVKYNKSRGHCWMVPPTDSIKIFNTDMKAPLSKSDQGKVCLINAVSKDLNPARLLLIPIMDNLKNQLSNEFEVKSIYGSEANLHFIKSGLKGYKVIYIISHGIYDGFNESYIVSGEEVSPFTKTDPFYRDFWYITILELRYNLIGGLQILPINYYMFEHTFIGNSYNDNDFPGSIIYLVACQAFKENTDLGETFCSKGASLVIGWDEANYKGPWTGEKLLVSMINGCSFGEAFDNLPLSDKRDDWCGWPRPGWYEGCLANLTYYPFNEESRNITLFPEIEIGYPILIYPQLGSNNIEFNPILDWTDVDAVNNYQVILSLDQEMSSLLIDEDAVTNSHFDVPDGILQAGTTYYWKVRAMVSDQPGPWSVKGFFTTKNNPPPSNGLIPLAVGNYWIYQPEGLPQTETVTILGSQEVQGVTCFEWFAQGDSYSYLLTNKADGCWCYGYGPYQLPPDLRYKYPVAEDDTWVSNWIAPPYPTTVTCLSTNASIGSYSGCILYNFYLPFAYHSLQTSSSLIQNKIDSLKGIDSRYSGFDIYDYFIPGIGYVGWETYLDGTLFVKAVLVDYHLNQ